jgi:hypothetical protein
MFMIDFTALRETLLSEAQSSRRLARSGVAD